MSKLNSAASLDKTQIYLIDRGQKRRLGFGFFVHGAWGEERVLGCVDDAGMHLRQRDSLSDLYNSANANALKFCKFVRS